MINRGIQKWKSDQKDSITVTHGSGESVEGLAEGGDELMGEGTLLRAYQREGMS